VVALRARGAGGAALSNSSRSASLQGSRCFNFNLSDKRLEREQRHPWAVGEERMSNFAIRLSTLAVYATVSAMVLMIAPADAASGKKHKHQWRTGINNHWYTGQVWPVMRPSGPVCPGLARSFDCKVWPPPFDEDPDRKVSGIDGG
jgi:hypothetical protein